MTDKSVICTERLRIPKPTQFGNKMLTAHKKYQMELDNNVRMLSIKYPLEPSLKIKELLEQLNNEVEMVQDLLKDQEHKIQSESKQKNVYVPKQKNPEKENEVLKRAIASIYKKLTTSNTQNKSLKEKNEKLEKEVEFYKNRSHLLSEEQFSHDFERNFNIF